MECLWVISPIFSCYFLLVLIIRSQQTLSVLDLNCLLVSFMPQLNRTMYIFVINSVFYLVSMSRRAICFCLYKSHKMEK